MCYPSSESKAAYQLRSNYAADMRLCFFCICKNPVFSWRGSIITGDIWYLHGRFGLYKKQYFLSKLLPSTRIELSLNGSNMIFLFIVNPIPIDIVLLYEKIMYER